MTLLFKDWSKHKAEEFNVTSELECAAHAILFKNSGSFYKMDGDNGCIIGTFNSKDNVNSTDVTEDDIHVNIGKCYRTGPQLTYIIICTNFL